MKCAVDTLNMCRRGISSNASTTGVTSENELQAGVSVNEWTLLYGRVLGIHSEIAVFAGTLSVSCAFTLTLA